MDMSPKEVLFYIDCKIEQSNKGLNNHQLDQLDIKRARLEKEGVEVA